MAVTAEQRHSRNAEPFQVHLVADSVAGLGAEDTVLFRNALDILVVIRVFKAGLQGVMVNIGDALLCLDPSDPHCFKLQVRHRTCRVLRQGLVDPDGDFLSGFRGAADKMRAQDFLSQIHVSSSGKKDGHSFG